MTSNILETRPLSHALGVEITGIDITHPLTEDDVDAIRALWQRHHILLFRGISWSPEAHMAFSRRFGGLDTHEATPRDRLEGHPELLHITNREKHGKPSDTRKAGRNWHSDYSYTARPAAASMLHCHEIPRTGGDTLFCNMAGAYDSLSSKLQGIVDELESVFDFSLVAGLGARDPAALEELLRINPPIAHPTVRAHPESGIKALYVSERVSHFEGMTREESQPLIDYLCQHATRHENVYRHQWEAGDLVCWDNRTAMHMALADFDPNEPRTMLRTTLLGEPSGRVVAPG